MTDMKFDPGRVLGDDIIKMKRRELCEFVSKLCEKIRAEAGSTGFRGGIYPENIFIDNDGKLSLGLARVKDWEGQELQFVAPELYWNSDNSPASDVYSLGLLLYYGVSGGRLPFENEPNPQLARMGGGEEIEAPIDGRLGEIIEKAVRFKAKDRYQTVEELQIMLDNCMKNSYIDGEKGAEGIFKKEDRELSEIERMMVGIINKTFEDGEIVPEKVEEPTESLSEEPPEELTEGAEPRTAPEETFEAEAENSAEEPGAEKQTEEVAEETEELLTEETLEQPAEEKTDKPTEEAAEEVPEAPEEVKVYKPRVREPIPILTEEKNPRLEPVTVSRPITPAVQYSKSIERERKIAEEVKKRRRRPVLAILIMCVALVVTAIIVNAVLKDMSGDSNVPANDGDTNIVDTQNGSTDILPRPDETAAPAAPETSEAPTEAAEAPKESTYQILVEDLSWTEARDKCTAMGGHLAVISDEAEFNKIVELAEAQGVNRLWIGCHRIDGTLVWESTDEVSFYPWAAGEPSYEDGYDGAAEDYLMLWNNNGWVYNDSRNDPIAEYPDLYSGTIGYVCEFDS